ncbi:ankyrin repeat domain-containing protein [Brevibacillus sp. B_LB10_24]|uniref:ankyrin repeat domain-containing protein n=1 Tax=Brevibacillus sp. B_LB10_24 TaxID=3380645 RepID=UPI0038B7866F
MSEQLLKAAETGDHAGVKALLEQGADVNVRDSRGRTPVMTATYGGHTEAVKTLIDAGADINIRDDRSDNVLLYAGAEGILDIVKLAIEAGADTTLTNRFGGTALIPACERGHVQVVKELLTHSDVDVNHVNNLGWTGLLEAIILSDGGLRHQEIVQLLVDHGADVNLADRDGVTPLQHAKKRGFKEMEQILLKAGAR